MKKFLVQGLVPGIGQRVHCITAADEESAWAKFCRAYAAVEPVRIEVSQRHLA